MVFCSIHSFLNWLEHHLLTCPSKYFFHFDCPGCGLQRSILALIKGDFVRSLQLYPATIPILFLIFYTILHLKFDFKSGAQVIKYIYLFTSIIVFIFYLYKIITHKNF